MTALPHILRDELARPKASQGKMTYYPKTWASWLTGIDEVTLDLTADVATIDRQGMCSFVSQNVAEHPVDAFVKVFQWGYGTSARGASRARRILTGGVHDRARTRSFDPLVADKLHASIDPILNGGPRAAYAQLASGEGKIAGFGPAFFTKWMYAVSSDGNASNPEALPVLDALVRDWLSREADVHLHYVSATDYARYVDVLDEWAAAGDGLVRTDIELAIFRLERAFRKERKEAK
jgi:hypothetical protein